MQCAQPQPMEILIFLWVYKVELNPPPIFDYDYGGTRPSWSRATMPLRYAMHSGRQRRMMKDPLIGFYDFKIEKGGSLWVLGNNQWIKWNFEIQVKVKAFLCRLFVIHIHIHEGREDSSRTPKTYHETMATKSNNGTWMRSFFGLTRRLIWHFEGKEEKKKKREEGVILLFPRFVNLISLVRNFPFAFLHHHQALRANTLEDWLELTRRGAPTFLRDSKNPF